MAKNRSTLHLNGEAVGNGGINCKFGIQLSGRLIQNY